MKTSLSAAEARRIAIAAQGLARPRPSTATAAHLARAFSRMGTLQIDSVNVFARSHYMPLFSRVGVYDTATADRLLFATGAPYVESWAHVAAFIPREDWGLFAFRHDANRARYGAKPDGWFSAHQDVVDAVRGELAARGPLRSSEIEHEVERTARGSWSSWNDVKRALEYLFLFGDVAVAGRKGFERRYALAEHVLSQEHRTPVPRDVATRELVQRAARAYGVATASDLADYWRLGDRARVLTAISDLVDAGTLHPVTVDGWDRAGRPLAAWLHRDAVMPRTVDATAILTPFDPMVWFRERAARLFGFEYRIEIYTPAAQRRFGYYSLPILVGDTIVGRTDLKADRASSTLLVQSVWWEHGRPDHAAERLAAEVQTAARWQKLDAISISSWGNGVADLADALPGAARHEAGPPAGSVDATA